MAVYAAREIYRFARLAGFTPDQAVTMTAIALAESDGNASAHNPRGEDSRGLWQINVAAHPDLGRRNLYDPLENAKAAFQVSGGGRDVSPWTTTHGGAAAPYVAHRAEALAAAAASGDQAAHGAWTGTGGYGHPLAAADTITGGGGGGIGSGVGIGSGGSTSGGGGVQPAPSGPLRTFLDSALAQRGDAYVWGAEARASDPNPRAFDCSELVQWAAARAGVQLPDGSWLQYRALADQGATISVEQALHTPGALLFSFSTLPTAGSGRPSEAHVAISLGDGRTVEAQSPSTGVGSWEAGNRFQYAAVIPGLATGTGGGAATSATGLSTLTGSATVTAAGRDTDGDGVTDALEVKLGLDPTKADTDGDGISDGYELLKLHTNPGRVDSDHDGLADSLELVLGTNPLDPDSDHDGRVDGADQLPGGTTDTDGDGVSDALEKILGTDPTRVDSDGDGFTDGAEYRSHFNPADAASSPLASTDSSSTAASGHHAASSALPDQSWGLDDLGTH